MKKKELDGLKEKGILDLRKLIAERRVELTKFYANLGAGKEKNLKLGKNLKREVAQISTVLHQKVAERENKNKQGLK